MVQLVRPLEARVTALEAELSRLQGGGPPPKTAANSAVPPAKGWKAARGAPPPGTARPKRGPKFAHIGASRRRRPRAQVDLVLACRPEQCAGGGAALPAPGGMVVASRQVTEVPPVRPVVIEAQRLRVRCRGCGPGTVGRSPDGVGAGGAFGPRLVAMAALLHEEQHVAYARLVEVFGGR